MCVCKCSGWTLISCWLADVASGHCSFSPDSPHCKKWTQEGRAVLTMTGNKFPTFISRHLPTLHCFLTDICRRPSRHAYQSGNSLLSLKLGWNGDIHGLGSARLFSVKVEWKSLNIWGIKSVAHNFRMVNFNLTLAVKVWIIDDKNDKIYF